MDFPKILLISYQMLPSRRCVGLKSRCSVYGVAYDLSDLYTYLTSRFSLEIKGNYSVDDAVELLNLKISSSFSVMSSQFVLFAACLSFGPLFSSIVNGILRSL